MLNAHRWAAACFAVASLLFVVYPVARPWHDETTAAGADQAMESPWWLVSHTSAMLAFILVGLGWLGVRDAIAGQRGGCSATVAVVTGWIGSGFTLTYYGAETFGLHAAARTGVDGLVTLSEELRLGTLPATMFALGLALLATAAICAALAVARSGLTNRYVGALAASGFILFLPQFFMPPALRIGHGVLLAAGLVWLAVGLWRSSGQHHAPRYATTAATVPS